MSAILSPTDPKLLPGSFDPGHLLNLLCLVDEYGPLSVCYDQDWPQRYKECYELQKMSQSRSVIDMMQQVLLREVHNLQRMVFSYRQDFNMSKYLSD